MPITRSFYTQPTAILPDDRSFQYVRIEPNSTNVYLGVTGGAVGDFILYLTLDLSPQKYNLVLKDGTNLVFEIDNDKSQSEITIAARAEIGWNITTDSNTSGFAIGIFT